MTLLLAFLIQGEAEFTRSIGKLAGKLSEQAAPSVVAIQVDRAEDPDGYNPSGGASPGYYRRPVGLVSGTIVESDGHILTSHFNVAGEPRKITVTLASGKSYDAKLLGYDKGRDLALLKIDARDLPVLRHGRIDEVKTGNFVFALGRSPAADRVTISEGIVSAVDRMQKSCFQLDAEVNFGSSGGPVIDVRGRWIGMVSKVSPKASWGQSGGVGFATRIDAIEGVLEKLKKGEKIEKIKTAWLGIMGADNEEPEGVKVQEVLGGSPAEAAGLKADDIVTKIDGKGVSSIEELRNVVQGKGIDTEVTLTLIREGKEQTLKVKLGENPND